MANADLRCSMQALDLARDPKSRPHIWEHWVSTVTGPQEISIDRFFCFELACALWLWDLESCRLWRRKWVLLWQIQLLGCTRNSAGETLVPLRRKRRAFSVDADNTGPALLISFHVSSFRMPEVMTHQPSQISSGSKTCQSGQSSFGHQTSKHPKHPSADKRINNGNNDQQ